MIKNIFIKLFLVIIFFSCKKENISSSNGNTSGNGSGVTITPSTATSWNGIFNVGKFYTITGGTITTFYNVTVNLFKIPQPFPGLSGLKIDSVKLNGIPLMFDPMSDSSYTDTSGFSSGIQPPIVYPYTYKVINTANSYLPSFTYTENGPFPTVTGYIAWPDTIIKSVGANISLVGAVNADQITINIHGGVYQASKTLVPPYPAIVNFSQADLSSIDTSIHSSIEVVLIKIDNKKVNGKPVMFGMGLNVTKNIPIK